MAALGGFFGGDKAGKHLHFVRLAEAMHRNFALSLTDATSDVLAALDVLTPREFVDFENAHSIEGLQELFRVHSIHVAVDPQTRTATLALMAAEQVGEEFQAEHSQVRTMHVGERHATQHIVKPATLAPLISEQPATAAIVAAVAAVAAVAPVSPLTGGPFERLASVEALCGNTLDIFVKYGQLNSADKAVLKAIKPNDTTLEARIVALERWQVELRRRMRALVIPKAAVQLSIDTNVVKQVNADEQGKTEEELKAEEQRKAEEQLVHRFEAIISWLARLIKEFETTGIKYQNKPVWLR